MLSKTEIVGNVTRTFGRVALKVKKHSPEILIAAGVVGTVTSAVMACKATMKVNDIIDESKKGIEAVHNTIEKVENGEKVFYAEEDGTEVEYTLETGKKDLAVVYVQTGFKFVKLYGPAVALGILSLAAILKSNSILNKRNAALAAAYATIDKSFKEYRGRVVERFGEALDKELRYNIKSKEVEEIVVNEDGTESVVKKDIEVVDPNLYSDYARFFDDGCNGWTKDPEFNLMFLKDQQRYANDLLKSRGHLFLNEVYDMLGIPRSKAGQAVGWIYDEKHPVGDNFVEFGIVDAHKPAARDFVNGYERTILLDFNVDGNIMDMI